MLVSHLQDLRVYFMLNHGYFLLGEPILRETGIGHTHYEETSSDLDTKNLWDFTEVKLQPVPSEPHNIID